jgi:hypothetical protein
VIDVHLAFDFLPKGINIEKIGIIIASGFILIDIARK